MVREALGDYSGKVGEKLPNVDSSEKRRYGPGNSYFGVVY
jgi:hypothetical protein